MRINQVIISDSPVSDRPTLKLIVKKNSLARLVLHTQIVGRIYPSKYLYERKEPNAEQTGRELSVYANVRGWRAHQQFSWMRL